MSSVPLPVQPFPPPNTRVPFVSSDGSLTTPGYYFLLNLFQQVTKQLSVSLLTAAIYSMGGQDTTMVFSGQTTATLNLLAAAAVPGRIIFVVNKNSGNLTITPKGSDTIDNGTVPAGKSFGLQSDGVSNWVQITGL